MGASAYDIAKFSSKEHKLGLAKKRLRLFQNRYARKVSFPEDASLPYKAEYYAERVAHWTARIMELSNGN